MTAKTFFKKIGRGLQRGVGDATKAFGAGVGSVLGPKAATYAIEAAPALLAFKTGGIVPGKKGKPVTILAHGGEYILPINTKPTKTQKSIFRTLRSKYYKDKMANR